MFLFEFLVVSVEKDFFELSFEVIIDKVIFDREFKDLYKENLNDLGGWVVYGDREFFVDLLEMNDKFFLLRNKEVGRYLFFVLFGR